MSSKVQPSVNNATDGSEAEEGWQCIDVYQRADLKHIATFSTFAPKGQTWLFNGSCTTGQDRCVCVCVCVF